MKRASSIKYFGVAAAALLAVAPLATPALTTMNREPITVQAATGTPAVITGETSIQNGDDVFAFVNSAYDSGTLTTVKAADLNKTLTFKDGDQTETINGVTYYVVEGTYRYNNAGNTVLKNGTYYVPAPITLTYNHAVNQYFRGDLTPTDVTVDGVHKAPTKVADKIVDRFTAGTAFVLALYTGQYTTTTQTPVVTKTTPDIEGHDAVAAGTVVYLQADGTYNTKADGSGITIANDNVIPATATTKSEIKSVPADSEVMEREDGTYGTMDNIAISASNVTEKVPAVKQTINGLDPHGGVYKLANGTYNNLPNGSGIRVPEERVTIPGQTTTRVGSVSAKTEVYKQDDGTFNTDLNGAGTSIPADKVIVTGQIMGQGVTVYQQADGTYNTEANGSGDTIDNAQVIQYMSRGFSDPVLSGTPLEKQPDGTYNTEEDGSGTTVAAQNIALKGKTISTVDTIITGTTVYKLADGTYNTKADGSGAPVDVWSIDETALTPAKVIHDVPATEAQAGISANTPVYLQADGTYNTQKDGSGTTVADKYVSTITNTTTKMNQQFYAIAYKGTTYFVPATDLTLSTSVVPNAVIGTLTTAYDDVRTYSDATTQNYTGKLIRAKGTQLRVDQQAIVNDKTVAYHIADDADTAAGTWVRAQDGAFDKSTLVASAEKGTVTALKDNTPLYMDKATTVSSGDQLIAQQDVAYTRVVKNSVTGAIVAYGFLNTNQGDAAYNQYVYVKADAVMRNKAADLDIAKLPAGTAVYSDHQTATIYQDAAATQDSGAKLSSDVEEWAAFATATDADGHIIAYRLGKNQWVKAADLALQHKLSGTFNVAAGTRLYATDGSKTGAIKKDGAYKVYAVRYINGHQALKLGTDNQWAIASQGAFYPA